MKFLQNFKFLQYFISLILLSLVTSHPISMICVPICNLNITANAEFVNEWLNHSSNTGLRQLQNRKGTVINDLLNDVSTDFDNCEEIYDSLVPAPKLTDISIDTIRGFFNAYLSHKFFIDYLVNLNVTGLLIEHWVNQPKATVAYKNLVKLQDVLNFNVKKLAQLLNTTCDACTNNCTQSTAVNATLIATMQKCISPIYNVVNTIESHSNKLLKTVKNLQDAVSESKNDDLTVEIEYNLEVNGGSCNEGVSCDGGCNEGDEDKDYT